VTVVPKEVPVAEQPLAGRTVVDLTTALAGPYATLLLGGLGARVIKVENPGTGGDSSRGNAPYLGRDGLSLGRRHDDDMSVSMLLRGRGKLGVTLDLKHPDGVAVLSDLVRRADVLVENYSAGVTGRLGIDYAAPNGPATPRGSSTRRWNNGSGRCRGVRGRTRPSHVDRRGLGYDMDFYRRFEERHGAVFVWSMYLAIAADGYPRYGADPLRTLAARFAAFNDQLYTPPWSCEWYVKEAKLHRVDGVVHLVSDDARGGYVTTRALRAAGIPVHELHADSVDTRSYRESTEDELADWIENTVTR
jgi:hypothetical protein